MPSEVLPAIRRPSDGHAFPSRDQESMKTTLFALALLGLQLLGSPQVTAAEEEHVALIKSVSGSVKVLRQTASLDAQAGTTLQVADRLQAGPPRLADLAQLLGALLENARVQHAGNADSWPTPEAYETFKDQAERLRDQAKELLPLAAYTAADALPAAIAGRQLLAVANQARLAYERRKRELRVMDFGDLLVKLLPVSHDDECPVARQGAQHLLREIDHRKALAAALRMPEHAEAAAILLQIPDGADRPVDAEILVVLGGLLHQPAALLLEGDEVLDIVEKPALGTQRADRGFEQKGQRLRQRRERAESGG